MQSFISSVMMWLIPIAICIIMIMTIIRQYKICPNDKVMVIYGAGSNDGSARIVHGGGRLVIPFLQNFKYMSLSPMSITVNLTKALSANNIRVDVPSQFTISVASKKPELMQNAVRYLLDLDEKAIHDASSEIILGALRAVVASLSIEELTRNREAFIRQINENVCTELNKIGMDLVNVNIRDITDESGYIQAMGQRAAAEAINKAQIDVSEQDRIGKIGVESNNRERDVTVAQQKTLSDIGITTAQQDRDVQVASLEAATIRGQNSAKAEIAESNSVLSVRESEYFQTGEVAKAKASTIVANEQRLSITAEIARDELPKSEVAKQQVEIEAEATAEQTRRHAAGEADAILLKYKAEATGLQLVLEAKAAGYKQIIEAAGGDANAAATLLMIEKMAEIVKINSEAMQNLKIDKITVWDSGSGNDGLQGFIRNFASSLPPLQEIAEQAGIKLPAFMGSLEAKAPQLVEKEIQQLA